MTEISKEQIDSLRELAETLTGKKLGTVKTADKLQAIIDVARAEKAEATDSAPTQAELLTRREKQRAEMMKLVRVNVTAMGPFDKQLQGNFFSAGNSIVGDVTRYIPFGVDWHIEQILLNTLREKVYRTKREYKDPTTRKTVYENRFFAAYGIVVLDDLTPEELAKHQQAMRAREYGEH